MVDSGSTVAEDLYDRTRLNGIPWFRRSFAPRNAAAKRASYVGPPTQFTAKPVKPAEAAWRSSDSIWPGSSCDHRSAGASVSWLPSYRLVGGHPAAGSDAGSGNGWAAYGEFGPSLSCQCFMLHHK